MGWRYEVFTLTRYRVLGIVYLNQLSGARHTHISYHDNAYISLALTKRKRLKHERVFEKNKFNLLQETIGPFWFRVGCVIFFCEQGSISQMVLHPSLSQTFTSQKASQKLGIGREHSA